MAVESYRGLVVGSVMCGLLLGVLLARPVSILLAERFGWRAVFGSSAIILSVMVLMLSLKLPKRIPAQTDNYRALIGSLWQLLCRERVLRNRSIYQACLFATYILFWTAIPQALAHAPFYLSTAEIALFTLTGLLGVFAAPLAGKQADRGRGKQVTVLALALVLISCLMVIAGGSNELAFLFIAVLLLDLGVQSNLVTGQKAIYSLSVHRFIVYLDGKSR